MQNTQTKIFIIKVIAKPPFALLLCHFFINHYTLYFTIWEISYKVKTGYCNFVSVYNILFLSTGLISLYNSSLHYNMIIPNSTFLHATHIEYYIYRLLLITFTAGRNIPNFSTEYCFSPTFLMPRYPKNSKYSSCDIPWKSNFLVSISIKNTL